MKKNLFIIFAAFAVLAAPLLCRAQQIPDTIFNTPSQAFGNTIADVPPDITSVKITPALPAAGKPVTVEAVISVDRAFSIFKVKKAQILYSTNEQNYTAAEMKLADEKKNLWRGTIPAFPAGTSVQYSVAAWDEVGNTVWQLPKQKKIDTKNMFTVITDERDDDIPGNLDILFNTYGTDGTTFNYCQNLRTTFQSYTLMNGASISAMGYLTDDVRVNRHKSGIENNESFIAYVPAINLSGKVRFDDLGKGNKSDDKVAVFSQGKRVCVKTAISELTANPAHGLKVFSATASINPATNDGMLVDATPYAILYFGGNSYTVK